MKKFYLALLTTLLSLGILTAQESPAQPTPSNEVAITSEMTVDYATLHQWLHSGNPRLIAWAADFARRDHETTIIAELPEVLDNMVIPAARGTNDLEQADRRAVLAVLDALIQEKVDVSNALIEQIAPSFPVQAVILITRKRLTESRSTLQDWTLNVTGDWSAETLARIATMMLAKDPLPSRTVWKRQDIGFVASVVDASEEELTINVLNKNEVLVINNSFGCGDSFPTALTPGWPVVYAYELREAFQRDAEGSIVIELGDDRISSIRAPENGARGGCNTEMVQPLNAETRHRVLAYWLGVKPKDMIWQPQESVSIIWNNQSDYESEVGSIVEEERRKLETTVKILCQKKLLKVDEQAMPKLVIEIKCAMKTCTNQ